ncbi:hypothetical protein ACN47E_000496 [Coniothyrium glycines]
MTAMNLVTDVRFEHYLSHHTLGVHETRPRLSWKLHNPSNGFEQHSYRVELSDESNRKPNVISDVTITSKLSSLVPWPFEEALRSRQSVSIRIKLQDKKGSETAWSSAVVLETGLLQRSDWQCERIAAPWAPQATGPDTEALLRHEQLIIGNITRARLYITAQGVYQAEINGNCVGDQFLAPGWTAYDGRLQYQTYDVTDMLLPGQVNCIAARIAEGWFCGRIGWEGGYRQIWGPHPTLMAQLEILYEDGSTEIVTSSSSWLAARGPIQLAELYDGEKYDATLETPDWSLPAASTTGLWEKVLTLPSLPDTTKLTAGTSGPVKRTQVLQPTQLIQSPSGKQIVDFGQNLVGYARLKDIVGQKGHKIVLKHAEVLENGEMCTRTLRICLATDEYTLKGDIAGEQYEPRFTFHGFRYVQIENWPTKLELSSMEAVVCHTEMQIVGSFTCSEPLLNQLYKNICWGMRGNFLSVPTDCPQRDERLGWSGDLALFAPTALLIYDCFGMLSNWLEDVEYDQSVLGGVPPMVSPNSTIVDPKWCRRVPCAIWHDVTILAPWALYQETGDIAILTRQYKSMLTWMQVLPRNKTGATHLWDDSVFQLGDWLDPMAPPDAPWKSHTDARMIANMFLIHSLELMTQISTILVHEKEASYFRKEALAAKAEFHNEYVSPNGRLVSDTQAAYALAIYFNLLSSVQQERASRRLVQLVRKNRFKIATGFAATPYICEALAMTGNIQVAYAMLLEKECPSWLYAVTMGATTVWERWDSMLPDGSVNPGDMTSFNHYAYGAVAKFMYERVAGLQRVEPGWTRCRVAPVMGAEFMNASASHLTPFGRVSCAWKRISGLAEGEHFSLEVSVPYGILAEIIIPEGDGERTEVVGSGEWSFQTIFDRGYDWPVQPLPSKS